MTPADVKWAAGIIARGAVHCVGDETVKALAKRVLELEAQVAARLDAKDMVRARVMEEREACAAIAEAWRPLDPHGTRIAEQIRARGAK